MKKKKERSEVGKKKERSKRTQKGRKRKKVRKQEKKKESETRKKKCPFGWVGVARVCFFLLSSPTKQGNCDAL